MSVLIETTVGDLVVDLFIKERPKSSYNFLKLCKMKYFNFSLFHSVQCSFIAQAGIPVKDPDNGGYSIYMYETQDETQKYFHREETPVINHTKKGMLSFSHHPGNCHGSQFFLTLNNNLKFLDKKHTVFGLVTEGLEILDIFNSTICDSKFRPYQDLRISHTTVLYDPFDEPSIQYPLSPLPSNDLLISYRIGAEEDINEYKGLTNEEIEKILEEKELKAGTQILELVGDIPDADMKPPENVLFICKLNPDTQEKDLKIIFSRFGKILSCDIIRDHRTGDSLQYGFIEFDKVEECERAYFKMDNVLIDDRRIHIDFCQSIHLSSWKNSKLRHKYYLRDDQESEKSDSSSSPHGAHSRASHGVGIDTLEGALKFTNS
ncbi:hypothetical protein HZS_7773, partial [Henneguya salminicola]